MKTEISADHLRHKKHICPCQHLLHGHHLVIVPVSLQQQSSCLVLCPVRVFGVQVLHYLLLVSNTISILVKNCRELPPSLLQLLGTEVHVGVQQVFSAGQLAITISIKLSHELLSILVKNCREL